jgi:hypothetical protein
MPRFKSPLAVFFACAVFACASSAPGQYSKSATDNARQGNFVNRAKSSDSDNSKSEPKKSTPPPVAPQRAAPQPVAPRAMNADEQRRRDLERSQDEQRRRDLERLERERDQDYDRNRRMLDARERLERQANASNSFSPQAGAVLPAAPQTFSGTGTVVSAKTGLVQVSADGDTWQIKPASGAKVEVLGTATPDYLGPGTTVKFDAPFVADTAGSNAVSPIRSIEIVTLGPSDAAGAVAVNPAEEIADLPKSAEWLQVTGRIRSIKNGAMIVDTGTSSHHAVLDPKSEIKVRVSDLSWARQGDAVEASGKITGPNAALANKVHISMAKPLSKPQTGGLPAAKSTRVQDAKPAAPTKTAAN